MPCFNSVVLVESVTSHGPVDSKRYIELNELFSNVNADLVFISAFPDRSTFVRFAHDIAWGNRSMDCRQSRPHDSF